MATSTMVMEIRRQWMILMVELTEFLKRLGDMQKKVRYQRCLQDI